MFKQKEITAITEALWFLPIEKLEEVKTLVMTLKDKHGYDEPIDDSDEWTDEDLREFSEASIRRIDQQNPWQDNQDDVQAG